MAKDMSKFKILVIDDEEGMCRLLKGILSENGYIVKTLTSPKRVLPLIQKEYFDIIITDIRMPDIDGVSLLREILALRPNQPVIMITAYGSIESAVEAIKIGAYDYITKPFQSDQVYHAIEKIIERLLLIEENKKLKNELETILRLNSGAIGKSRAFVESVSFAKKIANSNLNVLLTGESGTGKEVFAKLIHQESERRDKPFIPVQCSVIPVTLMESELFGYKKGSFTGAISDKKGIFEEADTGTVFLDEIGDIGIDIQGKLLRFLQEKEVRKIGDTKSKIIDVRLISATNKDLPQLVHDKSFREDLYYRLRTVEINIPSLRNRKDDIPLLSEHFLSVYNTLHSGSVRIDLECYKLLTSYDWPGNIRELRNIIETAATICDQKKIKYSDIAYLLRKDKKDINEFQTFGEMKKQFINDFESDYITQLIKKNKGSIAASAREAGMDKKNLWALMKKHSISAGHFKED